MDFSDIKWGEVVWPVVTLIIGWVIYQLLQKFFAARAKSSPNMILQRQITNFAFMLLMVIAFVLVLPIKDSLQGQIIGLIGILLSASIALSSTTFLGNLMAGIWLRSVKNFRVGDYVEVQENFGRISARGLLHIEIQNRERDLITLPNMYLVINPVTVRHNDGTIISTDISLGYDVDHSVVEPLLVAAAEKAQLESPFVYIESLGDFSIVYRIHGLAKNLNGLLSARSRLNACVLDSMHQAGIEIVSPSFMNQRQVNDTQYVPQQRLPKSSMKAVKPETMIFDKAEKAEKLDDKRSQHRELLAEIELTKSALKAEKDEEKQAALESRLNRLIEREERLDIYLRQKEKELSAEGKDSV